MRIETHEIHVNDDKSGSYNEIFILSKLQVRLYHAIHSFTRYR